jgi:peptidoglycan-associated lipoprotein
MRNKFGMMAVILMVIMGLMLTVSCAKKKIDGAGPSLTTGQDDADAARLRELERQKAIEEENLRRQRESADQGKMSGMDQFVNEDIHFNFDDSSLLPEAQEILQMKAKYLTQNPGMSIIIEGHCDERGTNDYNIALGDRRANGVKSFLMDLGIDASRMRAISYGEEKPLDPGHDESAWSKNRRAHFIVE